MDGMNAPDGTTPERRRVRVARNLAANIVKARASQMPKPKLRATRISVGEAMRQATPKRIQR